MNKIFLKTRAKINLTLNVLNKRQDNYHNIESVFQKISLYDELFIEKNSSGNFVLNCNIKSLENESNILFKTYNKLKELYPSITGVNVKLIKHIPIQAGLGGGSTNSSYFIKGMNNLFNLNMSLVDMINIGKTLGADVVPCMFDTAKSEGIGDIITPFKSNLKYYILIIKPDFKCNTKTMYEKLDSKSHLIQNFYTDEVIDILKSGQVKDLNNKLYNVFEQALEQENVLENLKKDFLNSGAVDSLLSGSGSCIYGIYKDKESINNAYTFMKNKYNYKLYKCVSYNSLKEN